MVESHRLEVFLRWGVAALLVGLGTLSLHRAAREKFDFEHFYRDASFVWQRGSLPPARAVQTPGDGEAHAANATAPSGTRSVELRGDGPAGSAGHARGERQLPFYLPAVAVLIAPVTAFGSLAAAAIWAGAQMAALAYTLRILSKWTTAAGTNAAAALGVTILLGIPALIEAARFNQLSYFILALVLCGYDHLERGRAWLGGGILGCAATIKLLPGIFLPWLLLKRQRPACAACVGFVVAAVVLAVVPPLLAFGPERTWRYHGEWWSYNVRGPSAGGLLDPNLPEHFTDRRNQSLPQVLARWFWAEHPHRVAWQPAHLPLTVLRAAGYIALGVLFVGLLWFSRRPWHAYAEHREGMPPTRGSTAPAFDQTHRIEFALFAMGMIVFSPLSRQYYLIWALPALTLLATQAGRETSPARSLGWAGLGVWLMGMALWALPECRVMGAHLWMVLILGGVLMRIARWERRAAVLTEGRAQTGVVG